MNQKPNKNPFQTDRAPATGSELTWIAALLALCLMANSWIGSNVTEAPIKHAPVPAAAVPAAAVPVLAPDRPDRARPEVNRERPWRDPAVNGLPSL